MDEDEEQAAQKRLQSYNVSEVRRLIAEDKEAEDGFVEPGTGKHCSGFFCNAALLSGVRTHVRAFSSTW
jgi:hypothetical protein